MKEFILNFRWTLICFGLLCLLYGWLLIYGLIEGASFEELIGVWFFFGFGLYGFAFFLFEEIVLRRYPNWVRNYRILFSALIIGVTAFGIYSKSNPIEWASLGVMVFIAIMVILFWRRKIPREKNKESWWMKYAVILSVTTPVATYLFVKILHYFK